MESIKIYVTLLVTLMFSDVARGHGGMTEPPMRSVAWKYGFDTPVNYDWMSLYCGGLNVFTQNNGTCGMCGDPITGPIENDKGGIYDTGVIVRHYPAGLREIEVKVEMTAHHKGHFQFKLCVNNADELTRDCLDRYPLTIREGRAQGDPTRYFPPKEPKLNELHVRLPDGVICDRCVLQWTYTAGNSLGRDIQETFVNCADISIGGKMDRIPVLNKQPIEGDVVIIGQGPNITEILSQAPIGPVNEVISALAANTETNAPHAHAMPHNHDVTSGRGTNGGRHTHGFSPDLNSRVNNNRDPRMFIPPLSEGETNTAGRTSLSSGRDTPGHSPVIGNVGHIQTPPGFNNIAGWTGNGWMPGNQIVSQGMFRPNVHGVHMWNGPSLGPQFARPQIHQAVLPPSQVWNSGHTSVNSNGKANGVINDQGNHNTLLGSVDSVVQQIRKEVPTNGVKQGANTQTSTVPSKDFIRQMNELRRVFPNSHEWIRGDGRWSHTHAVRQSPMYDTNDYTPGEIRRIVPTLPSEIGPRRDFSHLVDRRFHPNSMRFRSNWFPGSQNLMRRQRMRAAAHRRPRTQTRLPRRIEVQSMAVAQHLLRKYPQLRGRVFLSRQGHLRNTFGHMMHRYARRRNWSGL